MLRKFKNLTLFSKSFENQYPEKHAFVFNRNNIWHSNDDLKLEKLHPKRKYFGGFHQRVAGSRRSNSTN